MQEMIARHRTADAVIFLGDGARDIEAMRVLYPETAFYSVRGNCDFGADLPDELVLDLGGARIFCLLRTKAAVFSTVSRRGGDDTCENNIMEGRRI